MSPQRDSSTTLPPDCLLIMSQLRHPHLLLFMAIVLGNPSGPLIITELLDATLRHSYESNQLQHSNVLSIFSEVVAALNYLHLQRSTIIHRDVSSANVLLEKVFEDCWRAPNCLILGQPTSVLPLVREPFCM